MAPAHVSSPVGAAAEEAAGLLREAAGTARAAVYVSHPDGGYVLWAGDAAGSADASEMRLAWAGEKTGWMHGTDGSYLIVPLSYDGGAGVARLGPWIDRRISGMRRRAIRSAAEEASRLLILASARERRAAERGRRAARQVAVELASGRIHDLRALLLTAVKVELDADEVTLRNGRLRVAGARRTSPTAVAVIEEGLRHLDGRGGPRLLAYRMLRALADGVDARAEHTLGHSVRVARLAAAIARRMDCDRVTRRAAELGARLHDVAAGFCGSQALWKVKLDEVERAAVRRHSQLGAAVVAGAGLPYEVAAAVRGHHERWDGTGYPDGLSREEIPKAARIVALAETYDTLVTARPWRPGLPAAEALEAVMAEAGAGLDPDVVEAFLAEPLPA